MASRGGNRDRANSRRTDDNRNQNKRDEIVARDPDIGGVMTRQSYGPHMRERATEFKAGK